MVLKLTLKQKKFADEYIISGNATQAAIKAGYSKKTAYRIGAENVKKVQIKTYIDERLAKIDSKKIAKQEEVLQYLTAVMRGESTAQIVVVECAGDGISNAVRVDKAPDEKERLKAAELLGKRYRIFSEKTEADEEQLKKLDNILGAIDSAAQS